MAEMTNPYDKYWQNPASNNFKTKVKQVVNRQHLVASSPTGSVLDNKFIRVDEQNMENISELQTGGLKSSRKIGTLASQGSSGPEPQLDNWQSHHNS